MDASMFGSEVRRDAWLFGAVAMILLDWVVSVPWWHLEGNPVALALGPWGTLAVKTLAVVGLTYVWFERDAREHRLGPVLAVSLFLLHATVVVSNLAVIGVSVG